MTVVLIPGFAQTASVWNPVLTATDGDCLALEIPQLGSWSDTVEALAEMGGKGIYVGYSMGGRLALALALALPELVERLVLVSAGPGLARQHDREIRRASDAEWATLVVSEGVEAFLDEWLAQPMFSGVKQSGRAHRLADPGRIANQLKVLGQGAMPSYWGRLAELSMSVTALVGALDTKYTGIGRAMVDEVGSNAVLEVVPESGHAVPTERPEAIAALL